MAAPSCGELTTEQLRRPAQAPSSALTWLSALSETLLTCKKEAEVLLVNSLFPFIPALVGLTSVFSSLNAFDVNSGHSDARCTWVLNV